MPASPPKRTNDDAATPPTPPPARPAGEPSMTSLVSRALSCPAALISHAAGARHMLVHPRAGAAGSLPWAMDAVTAAEDPGPGAPGRTPVTHRLARPFNLSSRQDHRMRAWFLPMIPATRCHLSQLLLALNARETRKKTYRRQSGQSSTLALLMLNISKSLYGLLMGSHRGFSGSEVFSTTCRT